MKAIDIVLIIFAVTLAIGFTASVAYSQGHTCGYKQGVQHTRLYHEATQQYPTSSWLDAYRGYHFYAESDIVETLKPYKGE